MTTRALIIAVDQYPDLPRITGAVESAREFLDWVLTRDPAATVLFCCAEGVAKRTHPNSAEGVADALDLLLQEGAGSTPDFFFYFSGHGMEYPATSERAVPDALLVTAGFKSASLQKGAHCLRLSQIQSQLQFALGGVNHYYFIDACRVPVDPTEIKPRSLEFTAKLAMSGQPVVFTLYAAVQGMPTKNDTAFAHTLVAGLKGTGSAKSFVGGDYYVLFESLRGYVASVLAKDGRKIDSDIAPSLGRDDTKHGRLAPLKNVSPCTCHIVAVGADPQGDLRLTAIAVARARERRKIVGPTGSVNLPPDRYQFFLSQVAPENLEFDSTTPNRFDWIDLFDSRDLEFVPVNGGLESIVNVDEKAILRFNVPSNTQLRLISKRDSVSSLFDHGTHSSSLEPGEYEIALLQHGELLKGRILDLAAGEPRRYDAFLDCLTPAQTAMFKALSHSEEALDISESLGPLADPDVSVWLSLVGASAIIAAPGTFSKLQRLPLSSFSSLEQDEHGVYVLVATPTLTSFEALVDKGGGREVVAAPLIPLDGVPGVLHGGLSSASPVRAVCVSVPGRDRVLVSTATFPGRVTLVVCVASDGSGDGDGQPLVIRQLVLAPAHLQQHQPPETRSHEGNWSQLQAVRFLAQAQARFAARSRLAPAGEGLDQEIYASFTSIQRIDPIFSVLLGYELLRQGEVVGNRALLARLVEALRCYFPGHPDAEALAVLAGMRHTQVEQAPVIRDGVLILQISSEQPPLQALLGLDPRARLEFAGMWTSARSPSRDASVEELPSTK